MTPPERILPSVVDAQTVLDEARRLAAEHPTDVEAQIAAAYACDRHGDEADAVGYYDAAWALGVPDDKRREFLVGYGSTLRNVGRLRESMEILSRGLSDSPGFAPLHAFLALTLNSAGEHDEALAAALTALIEAGAENLDGYDRALAYYRDELRRDHRPGGSDLSARGAVCEGMAGVAVGVSSLVEPQDVREGSDAEGHGISPAGIGRRGP